MARTAKVEVSLTAESSEFVESVRRTTEAAVKALRGAEHRVRVARLDGALTIVVALFAVHLLVGLNAGGIVGVALAPIGQYLFGEWRAKKRADRKSA